jgi:hypothetical protein
MPEYGGGTHGRALLGQTSSGKYRITLLARYFDTLWLFSDLDFPAMKETQPDALFMRG